MLSLLQIDQQWGTHKGLKLFYYDLSFPLILRVETCKFPLGHGKKSVIVLLLIRICLSSNQDKTARNLTLLILLFFKFSIKFEG